MDDGWRGCDGSAGGGECFAGEDEVALVRVERALTCLDMWMVVESDGSVSTKVFRRDTHLDQHLNFSKN